MMGDGTFKTNSRAPRSMTTSHCRGFHVDLARRWTQIGHRRRRRHHDHVLSASPLPRAVRERARYTWTSACRRAGRASAGGRAGGRVAGRSRARDPTLACAPPWNPHMMMMTTATDDGGRRRRSDCRSAVAVGREPNQFVKSCPTECVL